MSMVEFREVAPGLRSPTQSLTGTLIAVPWPRPGLPLNVLNR